MHTRGNSDGSPTSRTWRIFPLSATPRRPARFIEIYLLRRALASVGLVVESHSPIRGDTRRYAAKRKQMPCHYAVYRTSNHLPFRSQQSNRVTMKLDVSYTDHSHIIGKGGLTIKRVMEETGCHIHFPDSNRSNHQEKSNQVSIAGEMDGVERARARVRVSRGPSRFRALGNQRSAR